VHVRERAFWILRKLSAFSSEKASEAMLLKQSLLKRGMDHSPSTRDDLIPTWQVWNPGQECMHDAANTGLNKGWSNSVRIYLPTKELFGLFGKQG